MRGFRSLAVLGALLAGLVAYIYFVDAKKPVEPEGMEKRDKVFTVESEKIEDLTVKASNGEVTTLRKIGGAWQTTAPASGKADASEVSGITTNLATVEVASVVDEAPKDLAQYGLASPRIEIGFKAQGDKAGHRLKLGGKTPTGGDLYAQRGTEARVFLVPAYLESSFDRKAFDLRDKSLLSFDRDKVDRIELAHGDVKIEVAKSGADWMVVSPIRAKADFSAIEQLITRLGSGQMTSIEADQAADLKPYGLDAPSATATVAAGSARATLLVGAPAPEGKTGVFVKDASRQFVALAGKDLADDLKKSVDDLRRKDIFEFRSFNTTRLEITRGAETFVFEKVKGTAKEGKDAAEKWRRTAPTAADVDAGKMETLLSGLSNLRAQSFADPKAKTGLDAPAVTISARFDETNKQDRAAFGRVGTDVFASRGDEASAARLDGAAFDEALKALDAVK
jgi:Domain of unknown function (DUF4340)